MQNGARKMNDTRYTSIYTNKKPITTHRAQLPADTCRKAPADLLDSYEVEGRIKAHYGKLPLSHGKGQL